MALYSIKSKIEKSNIDPEASSVLIPVWIRILGIPIHAKTEEFVREISSTVGESIEVDEISLMRVDPIRVKVFLVGTLVISIALSKFLLTLWDTK